jgi:hypothetical protein
LQSLLFLSLLVVTMPTMAQYKCQTGGATVYQERPCSQTAKPLELPGDTPVTADDRAQARARFLRQKAVADGIDQQHKVEQADINYRSAAVRRESNQKKQRCADLLRTAKDAHDESNKWRYHQGLIDDAKRRKREAEEAHFSECYGR